MLQSAKSLAIVYERVTKRLLIKSGGGNGPVKPSNLSADKVLTPPNTMGDKCVRKYSIRLNVKILMIRSLIYEFKRSLAGRVIESKFG